MESADRELARVRDYLSVNARDEALVVELTGIKEQIKNLKAAAEDVFSKNSQIEKQRKQAKKDSTQQTKQQALCKKLKEKHDAAKKLVSQTNEAIAKLLGDRPLREYRAEHDGLLREMAYLQKIASLEDERSKLEDNKPCPLCGALHHPFAEGNIPEIDETGEKNQKANLL